MRELTFDEMDMVSGGEDQIGEIIVHGSRSGSWFQQTIDAQKNVAWIDCMRANLWQDTAIGAVGGLVSGTEAGLAAGALLGPGGAVVGGATGALLGTALGALEGQIGTAAVCAVIPAGIHAPGR